MCTTALQTQSILNRLLVGSHHAILVFVEITFTDVLAAIKESNGFNQDQKFNILKDLLAKMLRSYRMFVRLSARTYECGTNLISG